MLSAWSRFPRLEAADGKYLCVDLAVKSKDALRASKLEADESGWFPYPVSIPWRAPLAVVYEGREAKHHSTSCWPLLAQEVTQVPCSC